LNDFLLRADRFSIPHRTDSNCGRSRAARRRLRLASCDVRSMSRPPLPILGGVCAFDASNAHARGSEALMLPRE
jgi:hypothetical protein